MARAGAANAAAGDLFKHTLYINLESRPDRRAHVEGELRKIKATGERFNAIKLADGALGCALSHLRCLQMAKAAGWPQVFICEDDLTFTHPKLVGIRVKKFLENISDWDVLIISGNNYPPFTEVKNADCVKVENCQCCTGYIVKQHYYDTIIQNFKESTAALAGNLDDRRKYACDIYWKRLQKPGNWFMISPAVATQRDDYSDIEKRNVSYSHMMLDVAKKDYLPPGKEFVVLETGETLIVDSAAVAAAAAASKGDANRDSLLKSDANRDSLLKDDANPAAGK